jgi:VanZ family protein
VHFSLNGALVFLWGFYLIKKSGAHHWRKLLLVFFFAIIYGIIIEILQEELTTSRMADFWDVVANTLGCFAGIFFLKLFKIKFSS